MHKTFSKATLNSRFWSQMCLLSHQLFPKLQSRVYIFHHLWTSQIYILYNQQVLFLLIPNLVHDSNLYPAPD